MPLLKNTTFNKNKNITFVTGSGKAIQHNTKFISPKNTNAAASTDARTNKNLTMFHETTDKILFGNQKERKHDTLALFEDSEDALGSQLSEQDRESQEEAFTTYIQSARIHKTLQQSDKSDGDNSIYQSEDENENEDENETEDESENENENKQQLQGKPAKENLTTTENHNSMDETPGTHSLNSNGKTNEVNISDIDFHKLQNMELKGKEKEQILHTITPGKTSDSNSIWNPYTKSYASINQENTSGKSPKAVKPLFSWSSTEINHLHNSRFISPEDTLDPANLNIIVKKYPDLATISALFQSQHNAYASLITELGIKTLDLTTMLENKKRMYHKMKDGFLPRSIRIKCQLTTSEDYRQDETFLQLQKLQDQHVAEFHENALDVFTKWHDRLINLINKDRLIYFLAKGTAILSRMIVFFQHCTNFKINWPSVTDTDICNKEYRQKILTLFLFKLYTSKHIMDISPLLEFLEVSNKEFTSVGAKLILNTNNDIKVEQEFHRLNVLHFNPSKKSEFEFVQEVLLSFDSILRYTSLELWNDKSLANRKATASEALEASLKADDITNTTELVAETTYNTKTKFKPTSNYA
jgi:hypothetical protein